MTCVDGNDEPRVRLVLDNEFASRVALVANVPLPDLNEPMGT